jgi:hypothetical protein
MARFGRYHVSVSQRLHEELGRRPSSEAASIWLIASSIPLLFVLDVAPARAQSCEATPGALIETYPASGSRGVPLNGLVRLTYCAEDEPTVDRSAARLLRDNGAAEAGCVCASGEECLDVGVRSRCLQAVPVIVAVLDERVELRAERPLQPMTTYVIEAPEPTGEARLSFTTGSVIDEAAPAFEGIESIRISGCGQGFAANVACPSSGEEGFVSILQAPAASDDAGSVNIDYRAFQIRENERIERGRVRGDGAQDVTISVFIPASELTASEWERICFTMTARDLYGFESASERTVCELTPEYSPFGSACAATPRRGAPVALPLSVVLLVGFLAVMRRGRARN